MHWVDIVEFVPLVERLEQLDSELAEIESAFATAGDPLGLLDDSERVIGEGFLLCQLYMIERKGDRSPASAYTCGPRQNSRYFAQVINAAGNYRKHRGEWPGDESEWSAQQQATAAIIRDAGVSESEFWLTNLLSRLNTPGTAGFAPLVPRLIEWREALDALPP